MREIRSSESLNSAGCPQPHGDSASVLITPDPGLPVRLVDDALHSLIACSIGKISCGLPVFHFELPR